MCKTTFTSGCVLILLTAGLLWLWTAPATAQTTEEPVAPETPVTEPETPDAEDLDPEPEGPEQETPDATNPPPFIADLVEATELTPEQLEQMWAAGAGWGNIKIAVRLAEQIAANSEGAVTFDDALAAVVAARADGKGFGQIAGENSLKVGPTVRNSNQRAAAALAAEAEAGEGEGLEAGETVTVQQKKQSVFTRLARFLGFGKQGPSNRPSKADKPERPERGGKGNKPERPVKLERSFRPERPERLEKPSKPEKPERPERPEKPEKPEKGPNR